MVKSVREPAMTDVAKLAGVSHQTVSRVLNGHPNVRQRTRIRVQAAITELGYRPNRAARLLATGTSQVIGFVSRFSTLYGPASMVTALAEAALQHGFTVNVESVRTLDRQPVAAAIGRLLDQRVAGLVVIAPVESANDALDDLPDDIPLVNVDGDPHRPTELVTVDQEAGARAATRHLLEAGHRTVWHVSGPGNWFDSQGRIAGWQQALAEAGADIPPVMPGGDWSAASGYRAGQILARMNDVTAVFAANDHLALGILRALNESGRKVPRDISVVGFDDVPEAAYFIPPLTTIRPDFDAVAAASLDLLIAQIRGGHRLGDRRIIAPALVSRESVAPPRIISS
ncbi:MAG TPA: LacI family DNA-binding transcriptional regulator [Streptosporangiaceae bacterium]|nr:LacI family DNA-binding transcriptional regulator [Streptosporangiaceae bacterium]